MIAKGIGMPVKWRQQFLLVGRWRAVPGWAAGAIGTVLVLRAAMTAGTALVTGALVGEVLASGQHRPADVTATVLWYTGVLLLGQVLNLVEEPLRYLTVRAIDGGHRRAVSRWAGAPDGVAHLEDPANQDDLLLAASDPDNWTEGTVGQAVWAQAFLLTRWAGGLSGLAVVGPDDPLVCVLVLAGLLVFRSGQRRGFLGVIRTWATQMTHRRRADYWTSLLTTPQPAKEIRVFGLRDWIGERYDEQARAHLDPFRRAKMADMRRQALWFAIALCVLTAAAYAVGVRALDGDVPIGRLSRDLTALILLFPLFALSDQMVSLEGGMPRLLALDRLGRVAAPGPGPRTTAAGAGTGDHAATALSDGMPPLVRFEQLSFSYPGSDRRVLDGMDLEIRPGEVLAVVGLNGAGKSTLIKILAGLYPPDAGRVTVNGADLRDIGVRAWRRRLSVVFQDFIRFDLSARENIALGDPDRATEQEIAVASEQAGVRDLIEGLPDGWETPLSPGMRGGVNLSGGQWQRVALARALLAVRTGARVLVLDEPTAHLDVHTEFEVFHQLIQAARGVSVVLISHRLSTVREADRIVLIEGGRVAESGSHQELIAADGEYARLFRLQAEQFGEPTAPGPRTSPETDDAEEEVRP
jgi:ATP-binding cassette subfamily B protein